MIKTDDIYLITGGCGHLGCNVVRELLANGCKVRVLALPSESTKSLEGLKVDIIRGDVRDAASMRAFFECEGQKTVIHAAGIVSIASAYDKRVHDVNVVGTKNIIAACKEHGAKLVYVSSVHAIPETAGVITETESFDETLVKGLYAKTKAEATGYVLEAAKQGMHAVVVHPSGIIGPNDYGRGHLNQMVIDFCKGKLTACIKGGYDFVDVRDVSKGIISAAEKGRSGECYILSGGYHTVHELLNELAHVTGRKRITTVLPAWFIELTAGMAELYYKILHQPPLFTRYSIYTLSTNANFSHEKASAELSYTVRPLQQTLRDTVAFLRQRGKI